MDEFIKESHEVKKPLDTIEAPSEIAEMVDNYVTETSQIKKTQKRLGTTKKLIADYANTVRAQRSMHNKFESFTLSGSKEMITYVCCDTGAGLGRKERAEFEEKHGNEAAKALIGLAFNSIKFDADVFKENYRVIFENLQKLPEPIRDQVLQPLVYKAKKGSVEKIKQFAKNDDQAQEMLRDLRISANLQL